MLDAKPPLVSIVISNYNYGRFLAETIQSALDQTYPHIEIIVVDDGSTDDSRQVLQQFKSSITVKFTQRQGQCAAVNAGFSLSQGEIIILLDSDDCLTPRSAACHVANFETNPDICKSQGYMQCVDSNGVDLHRTIPARLSPTGDYRTRVLNKGPWTVRNAWTSGNAWRRSFLKQVLPLPENPQHKTSPDGCLNILAALYGPIGSVHEPVVRYRIHGANIGPVSDVFTTASLRKRLAKMRSNFLFVREAAKTFGVTVPYDQWWYWKTSWKSNLSLLALSNLDLQTKPPSVRQVVFSPFMSRGFSLVRATGLCLMLTLLYGLPKPLRLQAMQRLLGLKNSSQPSSTNNTSAVID